MHLVPVDGTGVGGVYFSPKICRFLLYFIAYFLDLDLECGPSLILIYSQITDWSYTLNLHLELIKGVLDYGVEHMKFIGNDIKQ